MTSLKKATITALCECMGLSQNESCLIIFDKNKVEIANVMLQEAQKICSKVELLEIPVAKVNSFEPNTNVSNKMLKYDVIMIVTTKSLTHTQARKKACKNGARIASMPNILQESMKRAIDLDYKAMKQRTQKIKKLMDNGIFIKITTAQGTDIEMHLRTGKTVASYGLFRKKGESGNLPSGEAFMAPIEGSANGVFVVDASMAGIKDIKLKNPIEITVEKGIATQIQGEGEAVELYNMLEKLNDPNVYNIAEIGIGTNDKAMICGNVLEDEKVLGTAHIALGDNSTFGGNVKAATHVDGVFRNPTIFIDKKKIMENGKLLI